MRVDLSNKGHNIVIKDGFGIVGQFVGYVLYCYTCDPEGKAPESFILDEETTSEKAMERALAYGNEHSAEDAPVDFRI